jgi:hypothetical protein
MFSIENLETTTTLDRVWTYKIKFKMGTTQGPLLTSLVKKILNNGTCQMTYAK